MLQAGQSLCQLKMQCSARYPQLRMADSGRTSILCILFAERFSTTLGALFSVEEEAVLSSAEPMQSLTTSSCAKGASTVRTQI